jgi:hypothetical protein
VQVPSMLFHTLLVNELGAVVQADAVVVVTVVPATALPVAPGSSEPEPQAASAPTIRKPDAIRTTRQTAAAERAPIRRGGAWPPVSVRTRKPEFMTTSEQIRCTVLVSHADGRSGT